MCALHKFSRTLVNTSILIKGERTGKVVEMAEWRVLWRLWEWVGKGEEVVYTGDKVVRGAEGGGGGKEGMVFVKGRGIVVWEVV